MPEGPSLVILREATECFPGRKVMQVEGNSKQDLQRLKGRVLRGVRTWGKHFLLDFGDFAVRIHMLLFGSYRIDERKESPARLRLVFAKGRELNFYACSVKFIEGPLEDAYDWSADVMSDRWDPKAARKKLKAEPETIVADALLDQDVFAGVGNIIKNEVLHRIRLHPESRIGALPPRKLTELITQAREYSFDFYEWKKAFVLKKNWQVHAKRTCPRDGTPLSYAKHLGKAQRRAFWCHTCQRLYPETPAGVETVSRR
jgi:endonuclease VIII